MKTAPLPTALCAVALLATTAPGIAAGSEDEALAEIREATERYKDIEVARDDGYIRDPDDHCVTAKAEGFPPQLGAMGVHYLRPDLLGIAETESRVAGDGTHTDFTPPGVLVYEPQADGSLELVAVENLVFAEAWPPQDMKARRRSTGTNTIT